MPTQPYIYGPAWHVVALDGSPRISFGWSADNETAARKFAAWWNVDHEPVRAEPVTRPGNDFRECVRCGQTVITRDDVPRCETCQRLERQPQGEATRLFTPAPNQIPGQLAL
jgi:hypothetical protein